jgi:hypothetical protein
LYVAYVTRQKTGRDPLAEAELRLRAGVRTFEEAQKKCHPVRAGQAVKIVEVGAYKTGLLRVAPTDGSAPYWLSTFDVSRR